ncbi:hypothetical protein PFISCL1PPCAC_1354, partial [Pristionchus fissidentatus]
FQTVPCGNELESMYEETHGSSVDGMNKESLEDKEVAKYMCDDTELNIREINELHAGSLADVRECVEDSEQLDHVDATTWYTQMKDGEEFVYYEKSKQPVSRRRRPLAICTMEEELERLERRITLKDVIDDMSDSDSECSSPVTLSLASSPVSSILSLSDIDEEEVQDYP